MVNAIRGDSALIGGRVDAKMVKNIENERRFGTGMLTHLEIFH